MHIEPLCIAIHHCIIPLFLLHTHIHTHTHARAHTHAHAHVHTHVHMHTNACMHTHACKYICRHTRHTHTHTWIHKYNFPLTPPDTDVHPTPTPSMNRPANRSGLNAGPSVVRVRIISNHPMVYGILQRIMDNFLPK